MRLALASICIFLGSVLKVYAMDFLYPKNHCAAHEYSVTNPHSGDSGILLDASAWAEAGVCLRFPIEVLRKAAANFDVMTWSGVTRIVRVQELPRKAPDQLMHVLIEYEARHKHLFVCQTAQWPMEWSQTLVHGSRSGPSSTDIVAERVPGGDSNGAYIKRWSVRAELQPASANETSLHMRYEITAPGQSADWAVGAITGYIDRLTTVASGRKASGPVVDPDCPY